MMKVNYILKGLAQLAEGFGKVGIFDGITVEVGNYLGADLSAFMSYLSVIADEETEREENTVFFHLPGGNTVAIIYDSSDECSCSFFNRYVK